jgi:hypothetical protein
MFEYFKNQILRKMFKILQMTYLNPAYHAVLSRHSLSAKAEALARRGFIEGRLARVDLSGLGKSICILKP